ncbi:MAG: TIM barrel protein [Candidatus Paceibacterota bacterium]
MTKLKIGITVRIDGRSEIVQSVSRAISSGFKYLEVLLSNPETVNTGDMQALFELSRLTNVFISFHFPVTIVNLTGLGQGSFSEVRRDEDLRRAFQIISLASRLRIGGPITVHGDLYNRPLFDMADGMFQLSGSEPAETSHYFIDQRTGRPIGVIGETETVEIPIQAIDEQGNLLWINTPDGDPLISEITGERIPVQATDSSGIPQVQRVIFSEYRQQIAGQGGRKKADKIAFELFRQQQLARMSLGYLRIRERERLSKLGAERLERLRETDTYADKISKNLPPSDRWREERLVADRLNSLNIPVPGQLDTVQNILRVEIMNTQREMAESIEASNTERRQINDILEALKNARTVSDLALDRASDSFAKLGKYALDCSKGCRRPLVISIENMFPPRYASLADEVIELVSLSREKMAYSLRKEGYSREEAKESARTHLKATLDPAHLNLFYAFLTDGSENRTDFFNDWLVNQCMKLLQQDGLVSMIHLSDNDGYSDSHATLGAASIPYQRLLKVIEQTGFQGPVILETGRSGNYLDDLRYLGILPQDNSTGKEEKYL